MKARPNRHTLLLKSLREHILTYNHKWARLPAHELARKIFHLLREGVNFLHQDDLERLKSLNFEQVFYKLNFYDDDLFSRPKEMAS